MPAPISSGRGAGSLLSLGGTLEPVEPVGPDVVEEPARIGQTFCPKPVEPSVAAAASDDQAGFVEDT